jgi:hypothetical protein
MSNRALPFMVVLLVACGPKVESRVQVQLDPLPKDTEVKVFASDLPTCEYEQVGLIASEDLGATLTRAREMGANGVIGTVLADTTSSASPRSPWCPTTNCIQFNTVAIRFTDPGCTE